MASHPVPCLLVAATLAIPGPLLAQEPAEPTTHYVDNLGECAGHVPCHATIMDAVAAAAPFDSIAVFPGVYREAVVLDITKNDIVLRAHARALLPVIAAPPGAAAAVTLNGRGAQVRDFVLEAAEGAGIAINGPNEIRDGAIEVAIHGNLVKASRGIAFTGCLRSSVTGNLVLGGGIIVGRDSRGCVVEGNAVDGASIQMNSCRFQSGNLVRRNRVRGGGISIRCGEPLTGNLVESNWVEGGGITLGGVYIADANTIRRNVVRGGEISLAVLTSTLRMGSNLIESNVVSGSPLDGIVLRASGGGSTMVKKNTSVENARCDINDIVSSFPPPAPNTWEENRFRTQCGAATD